MDYMRTFELLLAPLLTLILTAIIVPYLRRLYRLHREEGLMIRKKLLEHTGVVIFGVFDGGLQSDYLALIEKRYAASFKEMKAARMLAEQLLAVHPEYYDAWIAVGVENYMLSVKPAPLRWLLRLNGGQTDRTLAIDKLRLTAERGHYLAPFARLLLAVTALRDRNTDRARELLTALAQEFPNNPLYTQELARLSD